MEIKLKTLTPLWTGDVNRECSKIKETGIIGSLRWWYEALVRGMGGFACDPTDDKDRCPNNEEKRCDACELFGCTGWRRRFNLRIKDTVPSNLNFLSRIEHPVFYHKGKERALKFWYEKLYGSSPKAFYNDGRIEIETYSNDTRLSDGDIKDVIGFLLRLLSVGGGLGAKNQIGFGVIKDESEGIDLNHGYEVLKSIRGKREEVITRKPTMEDYFKFEIDFSPDFLNEKNPKWYPPSPVQTDYLCMGFGLKFLVRNIIKEKNAISEEICKNYDEISENTQERKGSLEERRNYKLAKKYSSPNKVIARSLFGSDLEEKKVGLVHFSDLWRKNDTYKMRIWGFVPETIYFDDFEVRIDRGKLISSLKDIFEETFTVSSLSKPIYGNEILKEVFR